MKYYLVIPARYNSKRFPGKPLVDICGVPMIIRTYNQCKKVVPESKILVATDDKRIKKVCDNEKINVIMTSKKCLTGTDRIAEVAKKFKAGGGLKAEIPPSFIWLLFGAESTYGYVIFYYDYGY